MGTNPARSERLLTNPIAPQGQDPWVIQQGGEYYFCYSHAGGIWINRGNRIEEALQREGTKIWAPEPGKPYSHNIWAPELHWIQDKWYVYFAADDGRNENHRMFVLQSSTEDALEDYRFQGKLSDPTDKWAIDGTVLDWNEQLYFIWSGWEGDENVRQNLYIARMNDPMTLTGHRVLLSTPEYDWERVGVPEVNEGPQILKNEGRVFLIYSASGSWTDHYCLGQLNLVGDDPMKPENWIKKKTPVFGGTAGVISPGHASLTRSPDGTEDWIVYHAARHRGAGWDRNLRMQPFTWDVTGEPVFGYPISEGIGFPAPSE